MSASACTRSMPGLSMYGRLNVKCMYRVVRVLVSIRVNTRHDVEVVTVQQRTQRFVEYVVDNQLQHNSILG